MSNWPIEYAAKHDTYGADLSDSGGTSANGGGANTKGSYVEITASTARGYEAVVLVAAPRAPNRHLFDFAIGASGSEVVIVPNLMADSDRGSVSIEYHLPIAVPAGSRLAVRCQDPGSSAQFDLTVFGVAGGGDQPSGFSRLIDENVNTATTKGTVIDPGGVAHTKGSWTELTAASQKDYQAVNVFIGSNINVGTTTALWLLDIAIGASGSEQIILENFNLSVSSSVDAFPQNLGLFFASVPAGTRISARAQCSSIDATDRLFDLALHGLVQ